MQLKYLLRVDTGSSAACAMKNRILCCNYYVLHLSFSVGSSKELLNYTLSKRKDVLVALCLTWTEGVESCKIQFSNGPSYSNLSTPVSGPIGSPFPVRFVDGTSSVYYHQASTVVNSTLEIVVRSNGVFDIAPDSSTTVIGTADVPNFAVMLEAYQIGLIGLLMAILTFTLVICTGIIVFLTRRGKTACISAAHYVSVILSSKLPQVPNIRSRWCNSPELPQGSTFQLR